MTTTPALNDDLVRETEYVLLKRDLFECPRHQGYTGIRDKAGTWSLSYIQARDLPVKEAYDRSHEHYALPLPAAPEFTGACFDDLARDHLIEQRNAQSKEIEALRAALEPFDLQAAVYAAAQTWCGEKDRETFNSDIDYFRNNWSALKGLRPYVEREIGCRILVARTALKGA
jgi:hypothetical protein